MKMQVLVEHGGIYMILSVSSSSGGRHAMISKMALWRGAFDDAAAPGLGKCDGGSSFRNCLSHLPTSLGILTFSCEDTETLWVDDSGSWRFHWTTCHSMPGGWVNTSRLSASSCNFGFF